MALKQLDTRYYLKMVQVPQVDKIVKNYLLVKKLYRQDKKYHIYLNPLK